MSPVPGATRRFRGLDGSSIEGLLVRPRVLRLDGAARRVLIAISTRAIASGGRSANRARKPAAKARAKSAPGGRPQEERTSSRWGRDAN